MDRAFFIKLAQDTLREPHSAAEQIIGWNFPRDVLWTALALVAAINTFLVLLLVKTSASDMPLPGYFDSPLSLFVLLTGMMVVYVHAMYWVGSAILGGQGALMDVLALVVWFQVLRAVAQLGIIVLTLAIPAMGMMLSLVVAGWGFWIFLNFIKVAMQLSYIGHALLVLIVAAIGLVIGLGILLVVVGLFAQGVL